MYVICLTDVTVALDYWTNWDKGQPGGVFHKLKNCVRMVRRSNWQWHETPCHESFFRYPFICEYGMQSKPHSFFILPVYYNSCYIFPVCIFKRVLPRLQKVCLQIQ